MNIDKDEILALLHSQGKSDQAEQANNQLPQQVDTDNDHHAGLLSKFGIDPSELTSKLGGGLGDLGKLL